MNLLAHGMLIINMINTRVGGGAILSLGIHHIKGRHSVANQYNIVEVSGWRVVVKSVISVRKKVLCLED